MACIILVTKILATLRSIQSTFQVHAATQCEVEMVDKSTNYITSTQSTVEILSQEVSPAATSSIFGYTEMEESTINKTKTVLQSRKLFLDKMFRKPKLYLGLPKQYLWLVDYLVQKNTQQIDSLCIIVTLFKIKQNDSLERISDELELSRTKLATMILTGIEVLGIFFQYLIFNPHPKEIKKNLPLVFRITYSNVEMIINCLEIQITKPFDPIKQAQTWSHCKNCYTVKYLIGCTPNGLVSFISQGYGGGISDKALVEQSNLVDILQPNAVVLAARRFKEVEALFNSRGMKLLRPPSIQNGIKQSQAEILQSKVMASLVHVGRVVRRIRGFSLLKQHSVNSTYVPYLDEIVVIACGLVNLQELRHVPIIL